MTSERSIYDFFLKKFNFQAEDGAEEIGVANERIDRGSGSSKEHGRHAALVREGPRHHAGHRHAAQQIGSFSLSKKLQR